MSGTEKLDEALRTSEVKIMTTDTCTKVDPDGQTQSTGTLTSLQAILIGLVGMQYGPSMAAFGAYLVLYAPGAPLISLVVTIGMMLCLVRVIAYFAHKHVGSGGLLTYTLRSAGPFPAYLTAAALFLGYLGVLGSGVAFLGVFTLDIMTNLGFASVGQPIFQVSVIAAIIVLVTTVSFTGLEFSFKVMAGAGFICVPVVAWICIQYGIVNGIDVSHLWSMGGFSPSAVFTGVVFSASAFLGFDGLATVASATAHPKTNIPRVLTVAVAAGLPFLLFSLIFGSRLAIQFPSELEAGASPTSIMAKAAGLGWLSIPADILVGSGLFAGCVAFQNYASRVFVTMSGVSLLPRFLVSHLDINPTPRISVVFAGALSLIVTMAFYIVMGNNLTNAAIYLSTSISFTWSIAYIVISAVALFVVPKSGTGPLFTLFCAAISFLGFVAFELNGLQGGFSSENSKQACLCVGGVAFVAVVFWAVHSLKGSDRLELAKLDAVE